MSAGALEGLPPLWSDSEEYLPAPASPESSLAAAVAQLYFSLSHPFDRASFRRHLESSGLCEGIQRPGEGGLDTGRFFSTLAERMTDYAGPHDIAEAGWLIDPVTQALYARGYNDVPIDLRPLRKPVPVGSGLAGAPERLLRATYIGDALSLGYGCSCCDITHEGSHQRAGLNARESIFHLDNINLWALLTAGTERVGDRQPERCTFYVRGSIEPGALFSVRVGCPHLFREFLARGNTVLARGEEGDWCEVLP